MPVETTKNDVGGVSYYAEPASSALDDQRARSFLRDEEIEALTDFKSYWKKLAKGTSNTQVRAFLEALAASTLVCFGIHTSAWAPSLSGNYFRLALPSGSQLLVATRSLPIPANIPPWLRELYEAIGATREEEWIVAGGINSPDKLGQLEEPSEFAAEPPAGIAVEDLHVFFGTVHGDSICFAPNGRCFWFDHETESLSEVQEPMALVAEILSRHLDGRKVTAPQI